jgi:hypothetical protein
VHVCKPKSRVAIKTPRDHRAHTHSASRRAACITLLTHLKPVVPCKRIKEHKERDKKGVIDDKEGWRSSTAHTPFHTGVGLSCPIKCSALGSVNCQHTLVKQGARSAFTFANGPHAQACCTTAMSAAAAAAAAVCVCVWVCVGGVCGATVPPQIRSAPVQESTPLNSE